MAETSRYVLLIDDEPSILKTIGKRLQIEGFELIVAMDGEEALLKARTLQPRIIILDLMLPKVDGFEVCARLKQDPQCRHIPVIIFTGRNVDGDKERCLRLGAAAFVSKMERTEGLLQEIRPLLVEPREHSP